jgi:hypothetical protein
MYPNFSELYIPTVTFAFNVFIVVISSFCSTVVTYYTNWHDTCCYFSLPSICEITITRKDCSLLRYTLYHLKDACSSPLSLSLHNPSGGPRAQNPTRRGFQGPIPPPCRRGFQGSGHRQWPKM